MRPSAACEVWINRQRIGDTIPDYVGGEATALAPLTIAWGRDTPLDQPDTATATLTIGTLPGVPPLDAVAIGDTIDVYATATTGGGGAGTETISDGAFAGVPQPQLRAATDTYRPPYSTPEGYRFTTSAYHPEQGQVLARVFFGPLTKEYEPEQFLGWVPPRPFNNTDPTVWDDVPRYVPTQSVTWQWQATVLAPAGTTCNLCPVLFVDPRQPNYPTVPRPVKVWGLGTDFTATGQPQTITGTFDSEGKPGQTGWVGLAFLTNRSGLDDVPAAPTWEQGAGTWETFGVDGLTWDEPTVWIDDVSIVAPATAEARVLVFSGRVTDLAASLTGTGPRVDVAAADVSADLENAVVGDQPWAVERADARMKRIVSLVPAPVRPVWPAGVTQWAAQPVSWRDVDAQPAWGMLQDLAQSTGLVLWCATHLTRGPYLYPEDPAERAPISRWVWDGSTLDVSTTGTPLVLSACEIARDEPTWTQGVSDVITRTDLRWLEQTTDEDGQPSPTERTYTITDDDAEAAWGQRRLSVSTELTTAADAADLAERLFAISHHTGWTARTFTWDTVTAPEQVDTVDDRTRALTLLALLGGTSRLGAPLTITDLPRDVPGAPTLSSYVEGGTLVYDNGWTLELTVSPATYSGTDASAQWQDFPTAATWQATDPDVRWVDGWAAPPL